MTFKNNVRAHIAIVPDNFTVWAFSDAHGVRSGLLQALQQAHLADADGNWCGGSNVALVGCGDYIDRGTDSFGVLSLLRSLAEQAEKAGSMVVPAEGNHEVMALRAACGEREFQEIWLSQMAGGLNTMVEGGASRHGRSLRREGASVTMSIRAVLKPIVTQLQSMPTAVRWRDVLFVHAGLVPQGKLEDMLDDETHLWQRPQYQRAGDPIWDLTGPAYRHYHEAGIKRVVFGHSPQEDARPFQRGLALCIDTNAAARRPSEHDPRQATLTLARIPESGSLGESELVVVDTRLAPDREPLQDVKYTGS